MNSLSSLTSKLPCSTPRSALHLVSRFRGGCALHLQNGSMQIAPAYYGLANKYKMVVCFGAVPNIRAFSTKPKDDLEHIRKTLDTNNEEMITQLIEYKERNGDCHVPSTNSLFARKERDRLGVSDELAAWVSRQRSQYRNANSKRGKLNESLQIRILLLESMGFMWSEREAQWQRFFNRLEVYKAKHGNLEVEKARDIQLWTWMDQQRKAFQIDKLAEDRLVVLEEIGFVFDLQEAKWWESYEKLCKYKKTNGNTLVPVLSDDRYFGQWVARQRRLYTLEQLSEERIEALDRIGFSWDVHSESWEQYYEQLCEFHSTNDHTRVTKEDDASLWYWTDRQRRQLRKRASDSQSAEDLDKVSALERVGFNWSASGTEDRAKRLMDLTFRVDVHDERWMDNFKALYTFKEQLGHFSVPSEFPEYQELSNWVRHQRFLYKRNKMPKERFDLLEGINFAWTAQAARWDLMYEKLVRFHAENGHAVVPTKNAELYRWIREQRKALKFRSIFAGDSGRIDPRHLAVEKILAE